MTSAPHRIIAQTAKRIVVNCVRNTGLEDLHAGVQPLSHTGEFTDVVVIDADGIERPWDACAHISDAQMKDLMREISDRIFTYLICMEDSGFQELMRRYDLSTTDWDEPQISRKMLGAKLAARLLDDKTDPEDPS